MSKITGTFFNPRYITMITRGTYMPVASSTTMATINVYILGRDQPETLTYNSVEARDQAVEQLQIDIARANQQ